MRFEMDLKQDRRFMIGEHMRRFPLPFLLTLLLVLASCTFDPKAQARRSIENGNKFYAKARYKEASIMYRRALQKDARSGEAWYRLGLASIKSGAMGEAIRDLRRAVELEPRNGDAVTKLADLYVMASAQDPKRAVKVMEEARSLSLGILERDPRSYDAERLLGQLELLNGRPAESIKHFAKADAVKPLQFDLAQSYFRALVTNGQFTDAEKLAREMIGRDKTFSPIYDLLYAEYQKRDRLDDGERLLRLKVANNPQVPQFRSELAEHFRLLNRRAEMDTALEGLNDQSTFKDGPLLAGDFYFFRVHDLDRAQREYEAALQKVPANQVVYQKRLAELWATQPATRSKARAAVDTILKAHPNDDDALAMRSELMLASRDPQQVNQAIADLQALVTKTPRNYLLRYGLARAYAVNGSLDLARLQLEEAIKIQPSYLPARVLLAGVYSDKGDAGRALKASNEIIVLDKSNLQAHLIRASSLLREGNTAQSRDELSYLTKTFPQDKRVLLQSGYASLADKDYAKAERIFADLYKADAGNSSALAGLAEVLVAQNRLGDALKFVQAASDRQPERRDLKMMAGKLDLRAGRYDQAIALYWGMLEKEPKSADLLAQLGQAQWRKGDLDGATGNLKRCSQEAPSDTTCLRMLAELLKDSGKRDQAKAAYEQILRLSANDGPSLNSLALLKADEGNDLDQALILAQRARQLAPDSAPFADTIGWIYIRKGLSQDAIGIYTNLVRTSPGDATIHYHFAMALSQTGDNRGAKSELQAALECKPVKDQEARIRELLGKL